MAKTSLFAAAVLVASCASTKTTSFQDPEFRGRPFTRLVVLYANPLSLSGRQNVETHMVAALRDRGIYAVWGLSVFPPTRDMSPEEMSRALQVGGFDGLLVISRTGTGVQQTYVPPTTSTTTTTGTITSYGYGSASYSGTSTTYTPPGQTINRPWANFDTKVVDVATGRTAWIASAFTGGNGYANFDTVINSYCDTTAEDLVAQGVVVKVQMPVASPPPPPSPVITQPPPPGPCAAQAARAQQTQAAAGRAHQYAAQVCQDPSNSAACSSAQLAEQQQLSTAADDAAALSRCQAQHPQ
ncbi:MAG: hypothetical protein ACLPJH_11235 [Myxococcaceae bacterium]